MGFHCSENPSCTSLLNLVVFGIETAEIEMFFPISQPKMSTHTIQFQSLESSISSQSVGQSVHSVEGNPIPYKTEVWVLKRKIPSKPEEAITHQTNLHSEEYNCSPKFLRITWHLRFHTHYNWNQSTKCRDIFEAFGGEWAAESFDRFVFPVVLQDPASVPIGPWAMLQRGY